MQLAMDLKSCKLFEGLSDRDHFGEMALLDHRGRSAGVVAVSDLKVYAVSAWEFESFLAAHPKVAYRMQQTMSERLRDAQSA
jgi:CRP-like cAMP-binding protein